jgi:DNA-binding Xre family transcriptional regulator
MKEDINRAKLLASVHDLVVTSKEATQLLGITRARLSQLVKTGKLKPVKKNMYLVVDILERLETQNELRKKYYRPRTSEKINNTSVTKRGHSPRE